MRTNSFGLLPQYGEIFPILPREVKKFEIFPSLWYITRKGRPMKPFKDWKIRTKLISFTLLLGLVPMGVAAMLSLDKFTEDLKQAYESDLEHIVTNIYAMCKAQQELLQNKTHLRLKDCPPNLPPVRAECVRRPTTAGGIYGRRSTHQRSQSRSHSLLVDRGPGHHEGLHHRGPGPANGRGYVHHLSANRRGSALTHLHKCLAG